MAVHTTFRHYEIFLLKLNENLKIGRKSSKYSADLGQNERVQIAKKALDNARAKCLKTLKVRCPKTASFFGQDYTDSPERGCIIKPVDPDCYNSPKKRIECFSDFHDEKSLLFSVSFGRFDMVAIHPFPHAYWSSYFRTLLLMRTHLKEPVFSEVLCIPTNKIKFKSEKRIENGLAIYESHTEISDRNAFLCLLLISFDTSRVKSGFLEGLVNQLERLREAKKDNNLDLFLSYSIKFPLIVKAEFSSIYKMNEFIYLLKTYQEIDDVCSIISLNPKYPHIPEPVGGHEAKDDEFDFGILIKLSKDANSQSKLIRLKNTITDIVLKSGLIEKRENMKFFNRGFSWDLYLSLRTRKVFLFENTISGLLSNIKEIKQILSIPHWEIREMPDAKPMEREHGF